jgi:hypothetical protein
MCCDSNEIRTGIITGAVGGACASLLVITVVAIKNEILKACHKDRVFDFIRTRLRERNEKWCSTRTIASHTDLTMDRVRYICSIHKKIKLSTGDQDDMWGLEGISRDSK